LKWYPQDLFETASYNVYRQIENSNWEKINHHPITLGSVMPNKQQYEEDRYLSSTINLIKTKSAGQGIAKISILLQSFKSVPLCHYMGRYFIDSLPPLKGTFRYRVVKDVKTQAINLGETEFIRTESSKYANILSELSHRIEKNKVVFSCQQDANLFYGVLIYKKHTDSLERLLTPSPVLFNTSKTHVGEATETDIYSEKIPLEGGTYQYRFEVVNYFNALHKAVHPLTIEFPDQKAPSSINTQSAEVKGRIVIYNWTKVTIEKDLAGFNIYRTKNNDTDFVKLNSRLLDKELRTFRDSISDFQSYMYKISSVDRSGNESLSQAHMIEVPDIEAPSSPKNITITSDTGIIRITWDTNPEKDLWGYLVYRSINDTSLSGFVKITPTPLLKPDYFDQLPMHARNRFVYRILAIDQNFNKSAYTACISARMPDVLAPKAVIITDCKNTQNSVEINWLRNAESDLHHYLIKRSEYDTSLNSHQNFEIPATETKWTDNGAKKGSRYSYQIFAVDSAGNASIASSKRQVKLIMALPNDEHSELKTNITYQTQKNTLVLRWYPSVKTEVIGSVVFHRKTNESQLSPVTGMLNTTQFLTTDLTKEEKVWFQIRTYYKNGETEISQPIEINITKKNKLKKTKR
jgi:fibronectin type 3 domain-containing protein